MREDWEQLANKHNEYRVFIEFADEHKSLFSKWVNKKCEQAKSEARA